MSLSTRQSLLLWRVSNEYICLRCQSRRLSTSDFLGSGHSRWSTIKHDKGKNDARKNKERSVFSNEIATAAKLFGANPDQNPRLALIITNAKKAGFPKASIEAAIARGQGVSASGAALEAVTVEAILPPSVAVIIDCQTDNKLRTLADVKFAVKKSGGTVTPIEYMFEKKGRIVFKQKDGIGVDEILEPASEAGAVDVAEGEQGNVVVYTEVNDTKSTALGLSKDLDLEVESSEIIYDVNEDTKVELEDEESIKPLHEFIDKLEGIHGFSGLYINAAQGSLDDAAWAELKSRVSA
ncbi:YebC-like protein [Patellaria atrata CBS 101060]|uniref:YebC-like protein n=1 Tax=Patellaria atrata CBS 101060 TaxID=1346257 RepID=A0A9P4VL20_9PEZI|nr:YebC-like protein [Patellaria atrata CBS 101060]